jgi:hypothetical protein
MLRWPTVNQGLVWSLLFSFLRVVPGTAQVLVDESLDNGTNRITGTSVVCPAVSAKCRRGPAGRSDMPRKVTST